MYIDDKKREERKKYVRNYTMFRNGINGKLILFRCTCFNNRNQKYNVSIVNFHLFEYDSKRFASSTIDNEEIPRAERIIRKKVYV